MSVHELYVKGARVWVPNAGSVWEGATLLQDFQRGNDRVHLKADADSAKREVVIKSEKDLPPLRNPPILIGQNDLTALSYLHEPDVLYNLQVRFCERQKIYTYCGIILVAINPYQEMALYGQDLIQAYRGHSMGELEPHIFAIGEEAYTKLERENCNQSIIVSGESGAGKTVSAKYAMRYFAAVGGSASETQVERKVLASSPIMEAIGNAKTTRNDNSSRFGKFTKLLFTNDISGRSLMGATMQTYLLEKSRVVFQAAGERNYHIFYQLCAARENWPELMLDHQNKFNYLNQGRSPDIAKVSDFSQFSETVTALHTLGFRKDEVTDVMKILAGILHLGNVKFLPKCLPDSQEVDNEACVIAEDDLHLGILSELLQLNYMQLRKWLTTRQIESVNEFVEIPMHQEAAEAARDALAKHIYAKLFLYIVEGINRSLVSEAKEHSFIGVLDIYGFETFDVNSFEQFCINYANEKLQQQFNQHVFKLEQEEYLKEGITWEMIDFYDNQPCIDLIETKLGVLDLLDEECRMPRGSDESWVGKLIEKCAKFKHFEKTRFGCTGFVVKHFSDRVEYTAHGFLEKNRDTVSKQLVNVFWESKMDICNQVMNQDDSSGEKEQSREGTRVVVSTYQVPLTSTKQHKQTVGSQFRESLGLLIKTLHSTTPHYVRCIKPNEDKKAFNWEPTKIVQQLRACGVLETVRISAAGFPSRWTYEDFYARYRLLCKRAALLDWNINATCKNIVRTWIEDQDQYRYGNTQIFFRAGQVAFLEQTRSDVRKKYIIRVQAFVRRFIYRKRYLKIKRSVLLIQTYGRGHLARVKAQSIRRERAAIMLQRNIRGWMCRKRFSRIRCVALGLQKYARGFLARQRFRVMLDDFKATEVQRYCRGFLARSAFERKKRQIVLCQAMVRRFLARRLYKKMKAEARTVAHIQMRYKGLENKIISMQQRMDEINKENVALKTKVQEIPELKQRVEVVKGMEGEIKALRAALAERESVLVETKRQLDQERDEKMAIVEEKAAEEAKWTEQKTAWRRENEELKQQVEEMVEMARRDDSSMNRARLLSEVDTNEVHQAYQKTVKDKDTLEAENSMLKEEINRLQRLVENPNFYRSHSRSVSNASSQNEEDFGYMSGRNTLEIKKDCTSTPKRDVRHIETATTPTAGNSPTALILRLRKLLEEEKRKGEVLQQRVARIESKSSKVPATTEDSIKISELEMENDKLRQDYQLLRNSIERGVEEKELEAHYEALQEELKRRRDECVQLKVVLAEQSQSLRSLGGTTMKNGSERVHDGSELLEAFQAQKLVNRQLESELTALTEENNAKLAELSHQNDDLRSEKNKLQAIVEEALAGGDATNAQTVVFLKHELEKTVVDYVEQKEIVNELSKKVAELMRINGILSARLRENDISDALDLAEETTENLVSVRRKAQVYQGIFKYRPEDEGKIIQRLTTDLKPRTAITLLPGLPAYIILMCIRYTDLMNKDQHVRTLLANTVLTVKKLYRNPNPTDTRVLWLMNMLKLFNLLKQYGGIDEYIRLNTDTQNQQQLKNFDLSEYRKVIYETIIVIYQHLVRQIQELMKPSVVPAILLHDEMALGKSNRSRTASLELASPPGQGGKSFVEQLVEQLEQYYKQFDFFGLELCYIEQVLKQLMYYINAVALNNLMLRQELCTWATGMKMRYNVGCIETWVREKKLPKDILAPLKPLIQVTALLQSRKFEEDVETIYDLCPCLTSAQVLKIIKSYTADDLENPVTPVFIEKLTEKLHKREKNSEENTTFTTDENFIYPLVVGYIHSDIRLEEIELPPILNMDSLLTKI
ncbi:unconventional myosin-Va isoform X2 [Phlebotomus argentipes]|uniref:unconventional myosin-Va isoform X2 n=1 Tax=Phlebotomus argentipes TaxID=94469 RepID=UPI002892ACAD|nr:unconventional myosin-Va isoform X2 [Phlebotomus argentipes]